MDPFGMSRPNWHAAFAACVGLALCGAAATLPPSAARAEMAEAVAYVDGGALLSEDEVVRFVASLADMRRLAPDVAQSLRVGELNPDDPLMPYAELAEQAEAPQPEVTSVLEENEFATLEEWLRIGQSVMLAYWAREEEQTHLGLALQLAPIVLAMQGRSNPSAQEVSNLIDQIQADMTARSAAAHETPPAANLTLVGKYRGKIDDALRIHY